MERVTGLALVPTRAKTAVVTVLEREVVDQALVVSPFRSTKLMTRRNATNANRLVTGQETVHVKTVRGELPDVISG